AADDRQTARNLLHLQESIGIEDMHIVEGDFRWAMGRGAGGDENDLSAQAARSTGAAANRDGVSIFKGGLAVNQFDMVQLEILTNALAFHFHHFALVMHEVMDGEIFFQGIINAVESALAQAGKIERRFAQRLAGHSAGVDAASADLRGTLDDGHALAEISCLGAGLFARGPAADDHQIEVVACCQKESSESETEF